jgi:hypothetical protein
MRTKRKINPKIHPIDLDNSYTVSGRLKEIVGQLDRGEYHGVRGAVVLLRHEVDGRLRTRQWLCGTISNDAVAYMLQQSVQEFFD